MPSSRPPHPTPEERRARGRAARKVVRRSALGAVDPAARPDALATLLAQSARRDPELVPLRHGRMAASAWNFYRGAAAVMAADLATAPHTGLGVQMCGDAHVLNYGLWATPERNLAFDLRDFDETLPGPWEWDLLRLAASLVVVARHNGLPSATADDAVAAATSAYRERTATYADARHLDIWYDAIHVDALLDHFDDELRVRVADRVAKGRTRRTNVGAAKRFTTELGGRRRIVDEPPRLRRTSAPDAARIDAVLDAYRSTLTDDRRHCLDTFTLVDVARQVVGVGSVGMRVHLALFEGHDRDDPLLLQVKQAEASVYEAHLGPSRYANHGARVVNGKRLIQSATDIFVGWTSLDGHDFYVRQLRDMKIVPDSDRIAPALVPFASACGKVLAKAHARSGDPVALAAYLGKGGAVDDAVARFARAYADQTERDHAQLVAAIRAGRVPAEDG